MEKKAKTLVRVNTRIRPDQDRFVKNMAKKIDPVTKAKPTEGELYRLIIDYYIINHK